MFPKGAVFSFLLIFITATASSSSPQEHAVEVAGRSAGPEAEPGGPWDAVRIVAPRCEVYVCVGRADGAAR